MAHMWEEPDKARLTRGETYRETKEPPFPHVVTCNVVEEVKADQGPLVAEVISELEVIDLEIILQEASETEAYKPHGGDKEACKPHVEAIDQYSQVDLSREKCTCRSWGLKGISYAHAICCLFYKKLKPEDYISKYYTKEYHLKSYSYTTQLVRGMRLWEDSENLEIDPLVITKKLSISKKARRRDKDKVRKLGKFVKKRDENDTCNLQE
ncbi:hypothetical protein GH714_040263 [Hevea brasiliensis]|uniref:SWIM-type domain-containing protein n=1 Tax=Hevea brasiliensis TaxID=3981 RepID=A0A6A6K8Y2_HEVBR|nr:hypothetical protein GH714_040263 [Hevea brasiliensis]